MSTPNCYATFYENSSKDNNQPTGGTKTFDGPQNISDLSKYYWDGENTTVFNEMDDAISSLQTGSQAWLTAWSQSNYQGASYTYPPNTPYTQPLDGLNNTIVSFQLFDQAPVQIQDVYDNLAALYDAKYEQKFAGGSLEFYTQDCNYRLYLPTMFQSARVMAFTLNIDYDRSGGFDDHAVVTFSIDTSGNFVQQIQITYDMSASAYQVPQWAIDFIDDGIEEAEETAIEFLDGAEIALTLGVGTELIIPTDILILAAGELLTIGVNHINAVISKLFGMTDGGGTAYFSSTVAHAIGRTIYAYFQTLYGKDSGTLVTLDNDKLAAFFNTTWQTDKNNDYVLFTNNSSQYRCYVPDTTSLYAKAGLMVSSKIDAIKDNGQDDHLVLFATFDPNGKLFSVQGAIDIYGAPDNGDTSDYNAPNSGTIAYDKGGNIVQITNKTTVPLSGFTSLESAWQSCMQSALTNVSGENTSDFTAALNNVVNAGLQVLQGFEASVVA